MSKSYCTQCGAVLEAGSTAGEMTFTQKVPNVEGTLPGIELGPLKYLLSSGGNLLKGIKGIFKNKKSRIPIIVISLLWLILLLLSAFEVNVSVFRFLNFLTFAKGGTSGGLLGMAGGIVGKGLFGYFLTVLLLPLFSGGKPFVGLGSSLKSLYSTFAVKEKSGIALLFLGSGLALVSYNFLTGDASLENSMVGIVAFLVALRAFTNKAGFLRGFLMSFLGKYGRDKMPNPLYLKRIMAGWAMGFAFGIPLSALGINFIGYLIGLLLILGGFGLKIVSSRKEEVIAG